MSYQSNVYRVMLASPSDVKEERDIFPEILDTWNAQNSFHEKAVILPIKWETHSIPEMGDRPQAIINKLVNDSDILIGIFWTKLGTPTGVADSGSVEEIEEFRLNGKPVLLYFSDAPVVAGSINIEQYQSLKEFKDKCFLEGLVETYDSTNEFREKLLRHLLGTVRRLQGNETNIVNSSNQASPSVALVSEETKVKVDLEHSLSVAFDEREEYKLRINLINTGSKTISNYRLDIEFPKAFLNLSTVYALEVFERSNEKYKFFRVTQEHYRNEPIYPDDNRLVFIADYFIDASIPRTDALDEHFRVKVYIDDREVRIIDKPMSDLVDESWTKQF